MTRDELTTEHKVLKVGQRIDLDVLQPILINNQVFLASRKGQDEALEAAIQTTRWGCDTTVGHKAYSRAAFQLLHARFPASDATKRTKYWYN